MVFYDDECCRHDITLLLPCVLVWIWISIVYCRILCIVVFLCHLHCIRVIKIKTKTETISNSDKGISLITKLLSELPKTILWFLFFFFLYIIVEILIDTVRASKHNNKVIQQTKTIITFFIAVPFYLCDFFFLLSLFTCVNRILIAFIMK